MIAEQIVLTHFVFDYEKVHYFPYRQEWPEAVSEKGIAPPVVRL